MSGRPAAIVRYGERALLAQFDPGDGLGAVARWADAVLAVVAAGDLSGVSGVSDVVPAQQSVLVHLGRRATVDGVRSALERIAAGRTEPPADGAEPDGPSIEIPVAYDGVDLDEVGRLTGLGADGVVAAHTSARWRVAFCGFAPGFGYLVPDGDAGLDSALAVPRLETPRAWVPAGSVALAAGYSAVYPRASPGGWRLVGRTAVELWDGAADPPSPIRPGVLVRFTAIESRAGAA